MSAAYVTSAVAERLAAQLSERDGAILTDLARVRVLSGSQLTRLHFCDLDESNRERARRRVLARLVQSRLVATLERSVGGARAGSAGHVYSLGIAGRHVLPLLGAGGYENQSARIRSSVTPGTLFLAHSLAIAELYVCLVVAARMSTLTLTQFAAEPASWHPDGTGGVLKPDAYARLQADRIEDCWWIEVDRATESIPTIKKKLLAYVTFARSGDVGPDAVMPRILVTVPHDHRLTAVRDLVGRLPAPGPQLIFPVLHDRAVNFMITELRG